MDIVVPICNAGRYGFLCKIVFFGVASATTQEAFVFGDGQIYFENPKLCSSKSNPNSTRVRIEVESFETFTESLAYLLANLNILQ